MSDCFAKSVVEDVSESKLCDGDSCDVQIRKLKRHSRYGNPDTLILLASAYLNGEGVEKNPEMAIKKLKRATRAHSGKAMFMLAALYKDGIGTEVNIEQSDLWLKRSVAEGYPQALYQTALKTLDLKKEDNSAELALLLKAEERENKAAAYLLSVFRETGTLLEKDTVRAAEGYKNLAFWDYKDSKNRLENLAKNADETVEGYERISSLASDIERITVTGTKISYKMALDLTIDRVTRDSIYDGRSTGSHIPGRGCTQKTNCQVQSYAKGGPMLDTGAALATGN